MHRLSVYLILKKKTTAVRRNINCQRNYQDVTIKLLFIFKDNKQTSTTEQQQTDKHLTTLTNTLERSTEPFPAGTDSYTNEHPTTTRQTYSTTSPDLMTQHSVRNGILLIKT
jgi:hypothetical protein